MDGGVDGDGSRETIALLNLLDLSIQNRRSFPISRNIQPPYPFASVSITQPWLEQPQLRAEVTRIAPTARV